MTTVLDVPTEAATDLILRSYRFTQTDGSDGLTLEGYAAVFNEPTTIDSWEGTFTETIKPSAFDKVLRQNPRPVIQFDHGQHPLLGSIPIASLERLAVDKKGLFVRGRVFDNWLTEPVRDAIRGEAIEGMSFRFKVAEDKWSPDRSQRSIVEIGQLPELGPVVFPAYTGTEVSVRSLQLAEALRTDETARSDLAFALLLDPENRTEDHTPPTDPPDEPAPDEVADPPGDDVRNDPEADPEKTEEVEASAPNPARSRATEYAVRAALAAQRSNTYESDGLPDD